MRNIESGNTLSSQITIDTAKQALKEMNCGDAAKSMEIADKYLASIEEKGSSDEKKIAKTARNTVLKNSFENISSPCNVQGGTLVALAKGIDSPATQVISSIAPAILDTAFSFVDGRTIGKSFLEGICDATPLPTTRAAARATIDAVSKEMDDMSAFAVELLTFRFAASTINGPLGASLATLGMLGIELGLHDADRRKISHSFLNEIEKESQNPKEKLLAQTAEKAISGSVQDFSAIVARRTALAFIAKGPVEPNDKMLATYGRTTIQGLSSPIDSLKVGTAVLEAIVENTEREDIKKIAQNALNETSAAPDPMMAGFKQWQAFNEMEKI